MYLSYSYGNADEPRNSMIDLPALSEDWFVVFMCLPILLINTGMAEREKNSMKIILLSLLIVTLLQPECIANQHAIRASGEIEWPIYKTWTPWKFPAIQYNYACWWCNTLSAAEGREWPGSKGLALSQGSLIFPMYAYLQYSTKILLYEKGSQHYTDDGVSKVWLAVGADQKDHHKPCYSE